MSIIMTEDERTKRGEIANALIAAWSRLVKERIPAGPKRDERLQFVWNNAVGMACHTLPLDGVASLHGTKEQMEAEFYRWAKANAEVSSWILDEQQPRN